MSDFKAQDLSISLQKKLLGKMAKKSLAKLFIDDISAQLLDNLHRLSKFNGQYEKKESNKIVKHIIKLIIKTAIIAKNDCFTDDDLTDAEILKEEFRSICMTIVSFHELDFSYDRNYLISSLDKCKQTLKRLLKKYLSNKSMDRIEMIFNFYTKPEFLDTFFRQTDGEIKHLRDDIIRDLSILLEKGLI
ncbi:protein salivary glands marred-like [Oppia nitens]|uniref:protein salivary glands marred-like n=1 Tax=Oppia nitens TaxID=1686743 RepID=UPI0023DB1388|nr:protein salivary glands marred-like [Oppia nitens]